MIDGQHGPGIQISILYHEPLTLRGEQIRDQMPRWGFWNSKEDDHRGVRVKSGVAAEKSRDCSHQKADTPHKNA